MVVRIGCGYLCVMRSLCVPHVQTCSSSSTDTLCLPQPASSQNMAAPSSSRLSDLTSLERDLRAQIRTAQRASNRKRTRRDMCGFTCIELRFALRLYVLDGFDTKTSVVY